MRDIPGYEGLYAVTSCGKVWSYRSKRFLTSRIRKDGYIAVDLNVKNKRKTCLIHRLVAEAYIPNPDNKPQVSHLDETKNHNWIKNLEWATAKENCNYGTHNEKISNSHKRAVYCVELNQTFDSVGAAAAAFNVHYANISNCCLGKQKTTCGYHWRYADSAS